MGLIAREKRPAEQKPGKMLDDLPDTIALGVACCGKPIGIVRLVRPGSLPDLLPGLRQRGCAVDPAFFQRDEAGTQVAFLIDPDPDAPLPCQQDGLTVQGTPVPHQDDVRRMVLRHALTDPEGPFVIMAPPEADIAQPWPEDPFAAVGYNFAYPAAMFFKFFAQAIEKRPIRAL